MFKTMVDSAKFENHIYGVCSDCAKKALRLPENKNKEKFGVVWVQGECDVCHKIRPVCSVRAFDCPLFEIRGIQAWLAHDYGKALIEG